MVCELKNNQVEAEAQEEVGEIESILEEALKTPFAIRVDEELMVRHR